MQVTVTGRNVETTDALRQYATEKFMKLGKYLPGDVHALITLSVVKKIHHIADATLKANGILIQASEETQEMYASIDLLVEKIERRVRRYKEKLSSRKHEKSESPVEASPDTAREDRVPQIIKTKRFELKPMPPEEAVMQMELLDKTFFIFSNVRSGLISVIYRRKDGNIGLIEPSS